MASPQVQRRISQVYVELPLLSPRAQIANSKENLPLAIKATHAPRLSKSSMAEILKDKSSDDNAISSSAGRKRKLDNSDVQETSTKKLKTSEQVEDTDEKRCHQYGDDMDSIKKAGVKGATASERDQHIPDAKEYLFSCPRCQEECNCRLCRRSSGLAPTGAFARGEGKSAKDILKADPHAKAPPKDSPKKDPATKESRQKTEPKKTVAKPTEVKGAVVKKQGAIKAKAAAKQSAAKDAPANAPKAKRTAAKPVIEKPKLPAPPKIPRLPEWQDVLTDMDRKEVEDRIYLREFIVRFGPLLSLAKIHQDALDDFIHLSDAAVKAIAIALLDIMGIEEEGPHRKVIVNAVKDARSSSTPARLWAVLEQLRSAGVFHCADPTEPDPDRPQTRHSDKVAHGSQLFPALLALCERVALSASVRSEIDEGASNHPQYNRDHLYGPLKEVNEAWAMEKKALQDSKPREKEDATAWKAKYKKAETKHKTAVAEIEQAHYESDASYSPRFRSIGRDSAGRVYYILSTQKVKKVPAEGELENFGRWAWFVGVWGTPLQLEDGDDGSERWMGIRDPKEIKHTSKFLMAHTLNDEYCTAMNLPGPSLKSRTSRTTQSAARDHSPDPLRMSSPLSSPSEEDDDVKSETSSLTSLSDSDGDVPKDSLSDLSDLTSDEEDSTDRNRVAERKRQKHDQRVQKSIDQQMKRYYAPKPTAAEVKSMCKAMDEFADFLAWRLAKDGH
ncbi:hypothetical protein BKA62DRAFT_681842 [Auriculariales sp. MPI-PUGE-AT-0066]|nr:hypothetical protein BKA62DRAFT_681842 [Auriculariales sp. MPI-PUGE-AT-0066]